MANTAAPAPAVPADHLMGVYNRAPVAFERGEGVRLFTTDGRSYLDCMAGIATVGLGHCHPKLVETVKRQAEKLWHVSNVFRIPDQEALAKKLTDATFADVCFFTNSGTEAIECALKTARKYHAANGQPERIDVIAFDGSFHGRSYAAINAAGNPSYVEGFGPPLPGYVNLKFGDHEALKEAAARPTAAAILIEPVQGEGALALYLTTACAACASCATSMACCSSMTRCSAGSAAPASCSPMNGRARRSRTSWPRPRPSETASRWGRALPPPRRPRA